MKQIKIISNPYINKISYKIYKEDINDWIDIQEDNHRSELREYDSDKIFLPYKIKDILEIIKKEYVNGEDKISVIFEGTDEDYQELFDLLKDTKNGAYIELIRGNRILNSAKDILDIIKEQFDIDKPIIHKYSDDTNKFIEKNLSKISEAMNDTVPICVFGTYSSGKSMFINSLIGYEVLPCGDDATTAKVFSISRSPKLDEASVRFTSSNQNYTVYFYNDEYEIVGDEESLIANKIKDCIDYRDKTNIFESLHDTILIINDIEIDNNTIEISVPFSKEGVLGTSNNNFVIFDTPGSNSATNEDHTTVLFEALDGFSNGIPVLVTTNKTKDSDDLMDLCEKIMKIEALDKRFTMIIMNMSDNANLPKDGFSEKNINDIMSSSVIEMMYSSGVFYVSSVMGLGSKNEEGFISEKPQEDYYNKALMYSNDNYKFYKTDYKYNIMPTQIKDRLIKASKEHENKIYANSGLYCIELEMEIFANKYSAYNKCQMVNSFITDVIEDVKKRISNKQDETKEILENHKFKFSERENDLKGQIDDLVKKLENQYYKESREGIELFINGNLAFVHTVEEVREIESNLNEKHSISVDFDDVDKEYEGARDKIRNNLKENIDDLIGRKGSLKELIDDVSYDYYELKIVRDIRKEMKNAIDKQTSDKLIHLVNGEYKKNISEAFDKVLEYSNNYWIEKAESFKIELTNLITGGIELSSDQKSDISQIIMSFNPIEFEDEMNKTFVKSKYMRNVLLSIFLDKSDERLAIGRLTNSYNREIKNSVIGIAERINESGHNCYKDWMNKLLGEILSNLKKYNPDLYDLDIKINKNESELSSLTKDYDCLNGSFDLIKEKMDWMTITNGEK